MTRYSFRNHMNMLASIIIFWFLLVFTDAHRGTNQFIPQQSTQESHSVVVETSQSSVPGSIHRKLDTTTEQGTALCTFANDYTQLTILSTPWTVCPISYTSGTPSWCSWTSVTCDATTYDVTALALSTQSLSGNTLTQNSWNTFSALTALTSLALDGNSLSGKIPTVLGALNSLTSLDLSNQGSTNKLTGTLPSQLSSLTLLQTLVCFPTNHCYCPIHFHSSPS